MFPSRCQSRPRASRRRSRHVARMVRISSLRPIPRSTPGVRNHNSSLRRFSRTSRRHNGRQDKNSNRIMMSLTRQHIRNPLMYTKRRRQVHNIRRVRTHDRRCQGTGHTMRQSIQLHNTNQRNRRHSFNNNIRSRSRRRSCQVRVPTSNRRNRRPTRSSISRASQIRRHTRHIIIMVLTVTFRKTRSPSRIRGRSHIRRHNRGRRRSKSHNTSMSTSLLRHDRVHLDPLKQRSRGRHRRRRSNQVARERRRSSTIQISFRLSGLTRNVISHHSIVHVRHITRARHMNRRSRPGRRKDHSNHRRRRTSTRGVRRHHSRVMQRSHLRSSSRAFR